MHCEMKFLDSPTKVKKNYKINAEKRIQKSELEQPAEKNGAAILLAIQIVSCMLRHFSSRHPETRRIRKLLKKNGGFGIPISGANHLPKNSVTAIQE